MNKSGEINFYQIFFIGVFALIAIVFFIFFATQKTTNGNSGDGNVEITIWGTLPYDVLESTFIEIEDLGEGLSINYSYSDENSFINKFVNSVASGNQPDLVLLPHEVILKNVNILTTIPYDVVTESEYKSQFLPATNILLAEDGILGIPFAVDPLVAFYNKDILQSSFIVNTPTTWAEFVSEVVQNGTIRNESIILQASVGLGGSGNIENMKDIISTLFLQSGNKIVGLDNVSGKRLTSLVTEDFNVSAISENVLQFYTQFSEPNSNVYTWNNSLVKDTIFFLSNKLIYYFGFASEYPDLVKSSPNLSIGVSIVPQLSDESLKATFGRVYAFALPRSPNNYFESINVASLITNTYGVGEKVIPTALLFAYETLPSDEILNTNYRSAIISKNWIDPDFTETNLFFQEMVENIISGRFSIHESLEVFNSQLNNLLVQ